MSEQSILEIMFDQLWNDIDDLLNAKDNDEIQRIYQQAKEKSICITETFGYIVEERDAVLKKIEFIREIVKSVEK